MRRRKQKDKRVLKSRYGQPPKQKRRIRNKSRNRNNYYGPRKESKTSKTTMLLIILALIAFVAGAGVGVSMALGVFDDGNDDSVKVENVTVQMTTNLKNKSADIYYDDEKVDYNSREDIAQYNLTNATVMPY